MIELPNNCRMGEIKYYPSDWKTSKADFRLSWKISYWFYDDNLKERKKIVHKDFNKITSLKGKQDAVKFLVELRTKQLLNGVNPITKLTTVLVPEIITDISPDTPFIKSLWIAVEKIKVDPNYLIDFKCIIRGVEEAAKVLNIHDLPVEQVTRKYIKAILEKCAQLNKRWSNHRHNVYRKILIRLYKELIAMEAVDINPVNDIEIKIETKKEKVLLSEDDWDKINSDLRERHYEFWRAIIIFSCSFSRKTEMFNIQGKHVDFKNWDCLYTVKKGTVIREIRRPIIDAVKALWQEMMLTCGPEDYLFSVGLNPGPKHISPTQFNRRWKLHLKDGKDKDGEKFNIKSNLYWLKHKHTTKTMDYLDDGDKALDEVSKLNGHTSGRMIKDTYDLNHQKRKNDKVRKMPVSIGEINLN